MHAQRKVSNREGERKNGGGGEGDKERERNVLVTAMEHSSVCNSKHTKNIK
jgi:hypothetical protein